MFIIKMAMMIMAWIYGGRFPITICCSHLVRQFNCSHLVWHNYLQPFGEALLEDVVAKNWCLREPWCLLHCGNSFSYSSSFCLSHWRKARKDGESIQFYYPHGFGIMSCQLHLCQRSMHEEQMGMGSAMDTLCGQAFGAKQYHMLGIHMQRAMIVLTLVNIPIAVIWAYTGQILVACHQDEQISAAAGLYARWMIPSLFAYGLLQCHIRFLQSQNIVLPLMLCSGITTLIHICLCWLLVLKSSLGAQGAALAISVSYWVNVFLLAIYVNFSPSCKTTWTGFSREALKDVTKFLKLAIPSAAMICLEFWSFEILVLLSGLLPNPKLETSVMSIILNTSSVVFMIQVGLGAAISTRVSNEMGAGNPEAARLAICVVASMSIVVGLIVGLVLISIRNIWGHAYSSEREVIKSVGAMMPFLALSHLLDGTQCVLSGTARGCGRQKIGAFINLGSYYAVGIPSSVVLAFVAHLGIKGLWIGIIGALFLQDVLYTIITLCTDWEREVKKARDQVYNSTAFEEATV